MKTLHRTAVLIIVFLLAACSSDVELANITTESTLVPTSIVDSDGHGCGR